MFLESLLFTYVACLDATSDDKTLNTFTVIYNDDNAIEADLQLEDSPL